MNSLKDAKFLVSTAIKLVVNNDVMIRPIKKSLTKEKLFDLEEETLYDNGQIMLDGALYATDQIISETLNKLPSDKKITSIEITRENNILTFSLVY